MTIKFGMEINQRYPLKRMDVITPDGGKIFLDDNVRKGCVKFGTTHISFDLERFNPKFYSIKTKKHGNHQSINYIIAFPCDVRPNSQKDLQRLITKNKGYLDRAGLAHPQISPVIIFELNRTFPPLTGAPTLMNNIPLPTPSVSGGSQTTDFLRIDYNGDVAKWPIVIRPDGKENRFNVEFSNGACEILETVRIPKRSDFVLNKVGSDYYLTLKQQLSIGSTFILSNRFPSSLVDAFAEPLNRSKINRYRLDASIHTESTHDLTDAECKDVLTKMVMLSEDDWN